MTPLEQVARAMLKEEAGGKFPEKEVESFWLAEKDYYTKQAKAAITALIDCVEADSDEPIDGIGVQWLKELLKEGE